MPHKGRGRSLRAPATVSLGDLKEEPYASVLCYPRADEAELQSRIIELESLGVEAVEFLGKGNAANVPVLGKGYVGIVVVAHVRGRRAALKMRRVDADRVSLLHEAKMLARANSVRVGPRLVSDSKNFLLMQLIEGDLLPAWLEKGREKEVIRSVLADVLGQCWRLDSIGLDHGELSKAPKHLIVDGGLRAWIFDFETASDARRPANVTAVCQYLFLGGGAVAKSVKNALGEMDADRIKEALRFYKKERTRESFCGVLQVCRLVPECPD